MLEERFETFSVTIARIFRSLQKIKGDAMEPFGLKSSHFMCLFFLHHEDKPLTAAEISDLSSLDKGAVSRDIAELIKSGYVTYAESDDRRKYRSKIILTESGKRLSEKMTGIIEEIVQNAGNGLSDKERKVFYKGLLLISSNLQKYSGTTE